MFHVPIVFGLTLSPLRAPALYFPLVHSNNLSCTSLFCVLVQVISLDEFREGCRLLNKNLHPDYHLTDVEHMLKLMDFDGSGTIDINEFFEVRDNVFCVYCDACSMCNEYWPFCCLAMNCTIKSISPVFDLTLIACY